jgi:glycosyltransferase involved in cell wall biosynthesis
MVWVGLQSAKHSFPGGMNTVPMTWNYLGQQIAMTAGLDSASGQAIILMDGDLQDPPELIFQMVEKWREGFDVVYAQRKSRAGESRFKLMTASLFYRMMSKLAAIDLPRNVGDFRLIDRKALDAFARLDTQAAVSILKEDDLIDQEFDGFVRKLITYMMEDPRTISASLDLLFVAKAIERIGDHAKNVAELIIYIVKGADVRHVSMADIESAVQ